MGRAAKRKRRCKTCEGAGLIVSEPPRRLIQGTSTGIVVFTTTVERLCPKCTRGAPPPDLFDYSKPGRVLP